MGKRSVFQPIFTWEAYPPQAKTFWDSLQSSWMEGLKFWVWLAANRLGIIVKKDDRKVTHEFYEIDTDDLFESCQEHFLDVYRETGKRPTRLLVGKEKYREIGYASFSIQTGPIYSSYDRQGNEDLRIFGVKVELVPWMDGMVALHDPE